MTRCWEARLTLNIVACVTVQEMLADLDFIDLWHKQAINGFHLAKLTVLVKHYSLKGIDLYFLSVSVCLRVCICGTCVQCPQTPEEIIKINEFYTPLSSSPVLPDCLQSALPGGSYAQDYS